MARKNTYRVDEALEEEFNLKHLLLASKYIKRYLPKLLGAMTFSASIFTWAGTVISAFRISK